MTSTKFLKITFAPTTEHVATAVAAAGGSGHGSEEADLRHAMTFAQRVHVDNVEEYLLAMSEQGYAVINVQPTVPPIA